MTSFKIQFDTLINFSLLKLDENPEGNGVGQLWALSWESQEAAYSAIPCSLCWQLSFV